MARVGLDERRVVDAAAAIADADGLPAATLSAVARDVGVRTPSLYKHVDSLAGLHRLLALRALSELTAAMTEAATGRAGAEAVHAAAAAWRAYAHAHPGLYTAIAPYAPPTDGDADLDGAAAELIAALRAVLRAWPLDDDAIVDAIRGLRAAIHGYVTLERAGGFRLARDTDVSFRALIESLVAGLGPAA